MGTQSEPPAPPLVCWWPSSHSIGLYPSIAIIMGLLFGLLGRNLYGATPADLAGPRMGRKP